MFIELIISKSQSLHKFLKELNIDLLLTKKQRNYLVSFIFAMILKGYKGKITDVTEIAFERNRTSIGRFLSSSPWNEDLLSKFLNQHTLNRMIELSKKTGEPIYIVIDDTISKRTTPSSKAKKPIELCGYNYSHLERKYMGINFLQLRYNVEKLFYLCISKYMKNRAKVKFKWQ